MLVFGLLKFISRINHVYTNTKALSKIYPYYRAWPRIPSQIQPNLRTDRDYLLFGEDCAELEKYHDCRWIFRYAYKQNKKIYKIHNIEAVIGGAKIKLEDENGKVIGLNSEFGSEVIDINRLKEWISCREWLLSQHWIINLDP